MVGSQGAAPANVHKPMSVSSDSDGFRAETLAGFDVALGAHRGQNRAELDRLLASAREREIEQLARIAALSSQVESHRASVGRLEGGLANVRKLLAIRDQNLERSFFDLNAAVCTYLREHDEDEGSPMWGCARYSLGSSKYGRYQGVFSPRRPYLEGDEVHDGKDRYYTALVNINPSKVRPRRRPELWAHREDMSYPSEIGFRRHPASLVDDWRYGVDEFWGDGELQRFIAHARELAEAQWRRECNRAIIAFPCPAYAYRNGREWLEDMPGYRAAVAELRRRRRVHRASTAQERHRAPAAAQLQAD